MSARLLVAAAVLSTASVAAQQAAPQGEFRFERPVNTGGVGPRRLPVDVPLLSGSRPVQSSPQPGGGLDDVRLFTPSGEEVPYLLVAAPPDAPPLIAPLEFERRPSEPGVSRFRVRLPAERLPVVALDLDIGGGHVFRQPSVFESRLSRGELIPVALGRTTLTRVAQDGLPAALRVPIEPPSGRQLELALDDGSNPPLDLRGVSAVFAPLPWIYFESTADSVIARYGNASLQTPRYDLEAVRGSLDIDATPVASWGEQRTFASRQALPAVVPPPAGGSLDVGLFRYVRRIEPGEPGLIAIALDAAALAHSNVPSFSDVRVLDADGRQVPYIVERAAEPLTVTLSHQRLSTRPAGIDSKRMLSVYRVQWPFERLPFPRLVLTTSAIVFKRKVTIAVERQPDRSHRDPWVDPIAAADWVHTDQQTTAPALTFPIPATDVKTLLVIIDEGDNSALPIVSAHLLLPSYTLRLFRPQGSALRLVYGRDDLSPPRYDIALLSSQLVGVAATDVKPGAEATSPTARASTVMSPWVFWGVLGSAVLVLLVLIVRLVRTSEAEPTKA